MNKTGVLPVSVIKYNTKSKTFFEIGSMRINRMQ